MHNTGLEQWTGVRVYLRKTMYCISKVYPKYMVVGLLANLDNRTEPETQPQQAALQAISGIHHIPSLGKPFSILRLSWTLIPAFLGG
jgi:hypothetical protein